MERISRSIYFLLAPFCLIAAGVVIPIDGVLINVTLSTLVFLFAERLEGVSIGRFQLSRIFGKQLRFKTFYEENPPRRFLYYVLYPVILPYILYNKKARQEFSLYRGYALLNLILMLLGNTILYFRYWWPDIPVRAFLPNVFAQLLTEALMIALFVVPLTTTIVTYKLRGEARALRSLAALGALSLAFAGIAIMNTRDRKPVEFVSQRASARAEAHPEKALAAKQAALLQAQALLRQHPADITEHGLIIGDTRKEARHTLETFFLPDEAAAFFLWTSSAKDPATLILFIPRGFAVADWLALSSDGLLLTKEEELPPGALRATREAMK